MKRLPFAKLLENKWLLNSSVRVIVTLSSCSCITRSEWRIREKVAWDAIHQGEGFPRYSKPFVDRAAHVFSVRSTNAIDLEREPERC